MMPRFSPGQSGNPRGKPPGTRHKATLAAEALLDGEAEAITRKAIERALEGDATALRLCLDRILPPRKDRPLLINLPKLASASDATTALATVTEAVAAGEITPSEGADLNAVVAGFGKMLELADIEVRLRQLEERVSDGKQV
jgi:hypothetical protein